MVLNAVGCGNVGRARCRLWLRAGTFALGCLLNRSPGSARQAAGFIGAGTPVAGDAQLAPADAWLIGTPDDAFEDASARLA